MTHEKNNLMGITSAQPRPPQEKESITHQKPQLSGLIVIQGLHHRSSLPEGEMVQSCQLLCQKDVKVGPASGSFFPSKAEMNLVRLLEISGDEEE